MRKKAGTTSRAWTVMAGAPRRAATLAAGWRVCLVRARAFTVHAGRLLLAAWRGCGSAITKFRALVRLLRREPVNPLLELEDEPRHARAGVLRSVGTAVMVLALVAPVVVALKGVDGLSDRLPDPPPDDAMSQFETFAGAVFGSVLSLIGVDQERPARSSSSDKGGDTEDGHNWLDIPERWEDVIGLVDDHVLQDLCGSGNWCGAADVRMIIVIEDIGESVDDDSDITAAAVAAAIARSTQTDEDESGSVIGKTHTVQKGEYLGKIANMYDVPLRALLDANPQIRDKDKVNPGDVVNIPPAR